MKNALRFWIIWVDKDTDVEAEKVRLRQEGMTDGDALYLVSWQDEENR